MLAKPLRYSDVRGALDDLGEASALKVLQDLEEQAGDVADPVEFIRDRAAAAAPEEGRGDRKRGAGAVGAGGGVVARRVRLLNSSDLLSRPIAYDHVKDALDSVGVSQAMTILKGLEDSAHGVLDPTRYIMAAVKSAGGIVIGALEDDDDVADDVDMGAGGDEFDVPPRKMVKTEFGFQRGGTGTGMGGKTEDLSDRDRIERRVQWLNSNANLVKPLNFARVSDSLESIGVHQSMRVLRRLEECAETVDDPAAFVQELVGRSGWIWSKSDVIDEDARVAKRVQWLNNCGGLLRPIRYAEVADKLDGLKVQHAMVLLRELETSAATIQDPTSFIKTHCDQAGEDEVQAPMPEGSEESAAIQRIVEVNAAGKLAAPIDLLEVSAGLLRLGDDQALKLVAEVAQKGKGVKDPTAFIKFKLKAKLASMGFSLEDEQVADDETKIVRRIEWLNDYGGLVSDIDFGQVAHLLVGLGLEHAMTTLKELEDKKQNILDPTSFIKEAVLSSRKRSTVRASGSSEGMSRRSGATGSDGSEVGSLTNMLGLLNENSATGKPIKFTEVAGALDSLGPQRAYLVLQEMQQKGLGRGDPVQYIRSKASMLKPAKAEVEDEDEGDDVEQITRRVNWLNQFGGFPQKIQTKKVVGALYCLGTSQSMAILKGLQDKGGKVPDPTEYIKAAVQRANGVSSAKPEADPEEAEEDVPDFEEFDHALAEEAEAQADDGEMEGDLPAPSTPPDAVPGELKTKKASAAVQQRVVGAVKGLKKLTSAPTKGRPLVMPKEELHNAESASSRSGLGATSDEKQAECRSYALKQGLRLDAESLKALSRLPFFKAKDIVEECALGGKTRQGISNPSRYITLACERMSGGLGVEQGLAMELAVSLGVVLNNDALDELASIPRKESHSIIREVSRNSEARNAPIDFIQAEVWKCRMSLDARPFPLNT